MIRREVRKNNFDRDRVYVGDEHPVFGDPSDVTSVELIRGGSAYDPEMINSIVIMYADGTVETVTLIRGVNPPVPNTIPDFEFLNNALISGFTIETATPYGTKVANGNIVRENGYGKVQRLDITYVN